MNNNQQERYKIIEKNNKIKLQNPKENKLPKKLKILVLILMYILCSAAIIGLIIAILY